MLKSSQKKVYTLSDFLIIQKFCITFVYYVLKKGQNNCFVSKWYAKFDNANDMYFNFISPEELSS